jgi:hypothetical protein
MTEDKLNELLGSKKVEFVKNETPEQNEQGIPNLDTLDDYIVVLEALRRRKRHRTTAPAFKPLTLLEQIQFYDDGTNRRIYLYINNNWRYVALT